MAGFSDYLEDKVLDHVFGGSAYTAPSTLYVALYTVAPTDTGGGTEVSGGAYARQTATFSVSGTDPTTASNTAAIEYPTATADYGTVVAVGVFDALTSGNLLAYANLTASKVVSSGDIFRFNTGDLDITLA
jgi:cyclopropane fatty-acyl-phospholipid synthase-like methyltransferase